MTDTSDIIEQAPLQDRDLLLRLSLYFDAFEHRLRQGQGWFIFNAGGGSIAPHLDLHPASDLRVSAVRVDAYMMPWRDFALSAYVNEVGLPELLPAEDAAIGGPGRKARVRGRQAS